MSGATMANRVQQKVPGATSKTELGIASKNKNSGGGVGYFVRGGKGLRKVMVLIKQTKKTQQPRELKEGYERIQTTH